MGFFFPENHPDLIQNSEKICLSVCIVIQQIMKENVVFLSYCIHEGIFTVVA